MLLYGASGHAKVVCSALESVNQKVNIIFDDNTRKESLNAYRIIVGYDRDQYSNDQLIISIGDNSIRKRISLKVKHAFGECIAASAHCDTNVKIGKGTVVLHHAVIQRDAIIGDHCIINTSSSVDHDCVIDNYVHISPGATVCGSVNIGEGSHIGAGATIIPNIRIGRWCIIGAGSVVIQDIPDYSMVVGVPGKIIKYLNEVK